MNRFLTILLLFLTILPSNAQKNRPADSRDPNYTRNWKRADSLAKSGLVKSALEVVNQIYTRAKADRNDPQVVKAAMYRLIYQPYTTEETYAGVIESLRRDIADLPAPARTILQSILAETYWQYYERNRWKFNERNTDDSPSGDPRTWNLRRLVAETVAAYEASLTPADLLKKTPIDAFEVIVKKGDDDARPLRPTLYDFLAHRTLAFYKNTEPEITRPANRFELDQPAYLADANSFVRAKLTSSDSLSLNFRALRLYQNLIAFRQTDRADGLQSSLALADVDAQRLAFVHQHSTEVDKDARYEQTLERQIRLYKNKPAEVFYGLALVELWADLGDKTKTGGWRRKAVDVATDLIKRFPNSGIETANARRLLDRLSHQSLALTVEEGNDPDKPIRASVGYRNVRTLHYRIVRVSVGEQTRLDRRRYDADNKQLIRLYLKRPVVREGTVSLPDDGDLQEHRTEIALPPLPLGHYLVLTSPTARPTDTTELLSYTWLTVTAIGYLVGQQPATIRNEAGSGKKRNPTADEEEFVAQDPKLYVLNRQTGQPMAGVRVDVINADYTKNSEVPRVVGTVRTDVNGGLIVPDMTVSSGRSYRFRIITRHDSLETEPVYWPGYQGRTLSDPNEIRVLLFTDRAIYRPGQPIFFKGVLYNGAKNEFRVVANAKTEATLTDVNGEAISSLTLTSNAFGTVDGQFTAPTGRLTGVMVIRINNSQTVVRVEEYKRPTFEVKAEPVRGSYKLGEPVSVSATAKTFAGAVVDGASVRYRVVRRLRPRWIWWDWYGPGGRVPNGGRESEVANGVLTTDATGAVSLTFVAQPDPAVDRVTSPSFNFAITVDVTDRTGETRSAEQTLTIGYSALTATLDLPAQLDNRDRSIPLRVTNAGGERVTTTGQLIVSTLQPPGQPLRKRLWEHPDRFALDRDTFKKLFPTDVYTNEDQLLNWPKGKVVETVTADGADTIKLALSRYPAGTYAAELRVTDATGENTTLTQYFTVVTDEKPLSTAQPDGWVKALNPEVKPGQSAAFLLTNGDLGETGRALMRVVQNGRVRQERWVALTAEPVRVEVSITKAQVGGFVVSFTKVQNGRVYDVSKSVAVPMPDRNLRIETLTFRDHLKPGQAEQWTLRISGPGRSAGAVDSPSKEKLLAETVATLYDASLDAFVPLTWPTSPYQTPYQPMPRWWAQGFNTVASILLMYTYRTVEPLGRNYDMLTWGKYNRPGVQLLLDDNNALSEVVVTGYATRQKRDMAGAVAMRGGGAFAEAGMAKVESSVEAVVELEPAIAAENVNPNRPIAANPRRNFNETAFFFPKLQTDAQGRVLLNFTMPEALTRWRLMAFSHTPDLKTGSLNRTVVTQKELMISANVPRFLREGDTLRLTARINNLMAATDQNKPLTGIAHLEALDPATGQAITTRLFNASTSQPFTVASSQSAALAWTLVVPTNVENVTFRVSAQAGDFTDAEERTVPVLPNRMLVLDSQPFYVNGSEKKEIRLKALTNQNSELPSQAERLTVELTSNPVWTALQSLPYLAEFPHQCAEQVFSQFYANALASRIINARPDIRAVAEIWAKQAPVNPLEANPELKSVTLNETPWRRAARDQTRQQAQIGRFLQDENLLAGQQVALEKLQQLQTREGGFMWFSGMPVDRTISLHVLTGFGHLAKLGVVLPPRQQTIATALEGRALQFADEAAQQWVERQKQRKDVNYGDYWPVQYLYARSFYPAQPIADKSVRDYLQANITRNWLKQGIYEQALTALALHRLGDRQTPIAILKSLGERAASSYELGMYWPDNRSGYYWQQAPIETQALLIEAFSEITNDTKAVDAMKQWLLSQKRTQAWPSTKATTEAIYALLLSPISEKSSNWLDTKATAELRVGGKLIEANANELTGYQKVTYQSADIKTELGVVAVSKSGAGPVWGGIYYQHFEPLDRVTPSSETKDAMGSLTLTKQLFVQHDSPAGPVSTLVTDKTPLKPGDRLRVRLELRNDRDMQYVHLKDSRASGFEPAETLSGYKYQNGLSYYEALRDASTDFYLSNLPPGTHVFEYALRVVHTGDFATGVATVQCFYAPEFSARSTGNRVHVPTDLRVR
ncbi:alpha-2-macroglobulin family protein [Spirosoma arcticum]